MSFVQVRPVLLSFNALLLRVYPKDVLEALDEEAVGEMRRLYFAGWSEALKKFRDITHNIDEQKAAAELEAVEKELAAFFGALNPPKA